MRCDEAAEFVSALIDGETIPRAAAEHVGRCETCQARLREYVNIGAELRRVASLEMSAEVTPRIWKKRQNTFDSFWRKGKEAMRIPRFAFAALLMGIVALGSSLALVEVRAHSDGTVVLLKIARAPGEEQVCPLSTVDPKDAECAFFGQGQEKRVGYKINLLGREGNRVQLGVRTKLYPDLVAGGSTTYSLSDFEREPQKQYWFQPGETLKLDVAGLAPLPVTGQWMDHMPAFVTQNESHDLDPAPDELRILSPILLRDKKEAGDWEGSCVTVSQKGVISMYLPGEGLFELSLSPMKGAVEASVWLNRITFASDGRSYSFLTAAPATRNGHIFVAHSANFKPSGAAADTFFIGSREDQNNRMSNPPAKN